MGVFKNLEGQKFGRLTVLERAPNKKRQTVWKCLCDCGKISFPRAGGLKNGTTKSCGCLSSDITRERNYRHGFCKYKKNSRKYRFYVIYRSMIDRCINKNSTPYNNYGGRGINICDRWLGEYGFINFKEDMYFTYNENLTLDRIDNNKGYSKENCRWADCQMQNNNKRSVRKITFNGFTLTTREWSQKTNIPSYIILLRLNNYGWSINDALTIPVRSAVKRKANSKVIFNGEEMEIRKFCEMFNLDYILTYRRIFKFKWSPEKVIEKEKLHKSITKNK